MQMHKGGYRDVDRREGEAESSRTPEFCKGLFVQCEKKM